MAKNSHKIAEKGTPPKVIRTKGGYSGSGHFLISVPEYASRIKHYADDAGTAWDVVRPVSRGYDVKGIMQGAPQPLHLIDAMLASVKQPAKELLISAWHISNIDAETILQWKNKGRVRSVKIVVSPLKASRNSGRGQKSFIDAFGEDSIRFYHVDTRFAVVHGGGGETISFDTSANLARSDAVNLVNVSSRPDTAMFLSWYIEEIFNKTKSGEQSSSKYKPINLAPLRKKLATLSPNVALNGSGDGDKQPPEVPCEEVEGTSSSLTVQQVAKWTGKRADTLERMVSIQALPSLEDGGWQLKSLLNLLINLAVSNGGSKSKEELEKAQTRLANRNEQLKELEFLEKRGELIDGNVFYPMLDSVFELLRDSLEGLPLQISKSLNLTDNARLMVESMLKENIDNVLHNLSDSIKKIAVGNANGTQTKGQ